MKTWLLTLCWLTLTGSILATEPAYEFNTPLIPMRAFTGAELFCKNNSIKKDVEVEALIRDARGTVIDHSSFLLAPGQFQSLDLMALGLPRPMPDLRVTLRYTGGSGGQISAKVSASNPGRRYSYTVPAINAPFEFANTRISALAWLPDKKATLTVFLTNLSDSRIEASLQARSGQLLAAQRKAVLQPGHSRRLRFSNLQPGAVGLTLEHDGQPGDLIAAGLALDEDSGFSKPVAFSDPNWSQSQRIVVSQVLLGELPESIPSSFRDISAFKSFLLLYNTSETPQRVNLTLATPQESYDLPEIALAGNQAVEIPLSGMQSRGLLPEFEQNAFLVGEHSGERGSLIGEVLTVGAGNDLVLGAPMKTQQGFAFNMTEWRTDGAFNTLLSLFNTTEEDSAVDIAVTHEGERFIHTLHIEPASQVTVDFRSLIENAQLISPNSRTLPRDLSRGTFELDNHRVNDGLIPHFQVINADQATCEPGTGEMAYYVSTAFEWIQDPEEEGGRVMLQNHGLMSNDDTKNVTGSVGHPA